MKVIFLDIDGVISKMGPKGNLSLFGLSKPLLRNLSFLVKTSGAKIVLSSTWRLLPSTRHRLDRALRFRGLRIYSSTPVFHHINGGGIKARQAEIEKWLEDHPGVEEYVVIDDIPDYFTNPVAKHLVACDPEVGLSEEKVQEAFKILKVEND